MDDVYFACLTCKSYIDAGYRWCLSTLERPGHVQPGQTVSIATVLEANEYWLGVKATKPLQDLLPEIHKFLVGHQSHEVIYGQRSDFLTRAGDGDFLDWVDEGGNDTQLVPRYFVERLGLWTWDQVAAHVSKLKLYPWWWGVHDFQTKARARFQKLIAERKNGRAHG